MAQNDIDRLEYFIDTDPGIGNGTTVPVTIGLTINKTFVVPTSTLPVGFHTVYFRVHNVNNTSSDSWSIVESRSFYISPSNLTTQTNIIKIEYFINTDPGYGNGVSLSLTAGTMIDMSTIITTSSLAAGHHVLYIRAQDSDAVWGEQESRSFYIDQFAAGKIAGIEYFFDTDPGYGSGNNLAILPVKDSIDSVINVPTVPLTAGTHMLGLRVLSDNGAYGITDYYNITLCDGATASLSGNNVCMGSNTLFTDASTNVQAGDVYSWDFDNDGVEDANTSGNQSFTYLAPGTYWAKLAIDRAGCISVDSVQVSVETLPIANAGPDQTICSDNITLAGNPAGVNETGNWQLITGAATITNPTDPLTTLTSIASDTLELSWTVTNSVGGCTVVDNMIITSSVLLNANFSAVPSCIKNPILFSDNTTNTYISDTYAWDFDGDGFIDATTAGDQTFNYAASGTYIASLTISRGLCASTFTTSVDVFDNPVSNAGADQSVCTQSATLEGNLPAVNESGLWQIINGSAVITNNNDPVSTLTGITSTSVELSWTITNTDTSCQAVDTVLISTNLPLTASLLAATVDIGQVINVDVQTSAIINTGDVLTTSITNNPVFGVVNILANGTIDYNPNPDAPTKDSLLYRITNQCNNFAENQIIYTVNNLPPLIDSTSFTATKNASQLTFDLTTLISDPNNNLDFSTLKIITQPVSGAVATIDVNGVLSIDYIGVTFSGTDQLEIEICDLVGDCSVQAITIPNVEVGGTNPPISVFNGVSPNGDGFNDFLDIKNIEFYPDNIVVILNRWGAEIVRFQGYNNQDIVFKDASLPSGTYYYHIIPGVKDVKEITGHFVLKVD